MSGGQNGEHALGRLVVVLELTLCALTPAAGTVETVRRAISSPPGGTSLREARHWIKSPQKQCSAGPGSGDNEWSAPATPYQPDSSDRVNESDLSMA